MPQRTLASALPQQTLLTVSPDDTVQRSAVLMAQARCGSALVLDATGLVGIVTERDILNKVIAESRDPDTTRIGEIMTRRPHCARADMPVSYALFTMREYGFRHMPVVNRNNHPIGVFSIRDALPEELAGADEIERHAEYVANNLR